YAVIIGFFFSSRRLHTRCYRDWSSDVCSSDLTLEEKLTESASGVPGLDFYGGIVAWLIMKCGLSPMTIAKVCSGNQARFFGLREDRKSVVRERGERSGGDEAGKGEHKMRSDRQ